MTLNSSARSSTDSRTTLNAGARRLNLGARRLYASDIVMSPMRAIVLKNNALSNATDYPAPTPRGDEVLVRVLRAGVCETDLQLIRGYMGFNGVLGHEFVGTAESGPFKGRRVVGEINCSCWTCATCSAGRPSHCPNRSVIGILNHDGAFADFIAVPQRNLHVVPESMPDDVAVFTEPVAAAFQIPAQIAIGRQDRIVVLGDGRLGNLCAQVLARLSSDVTVVGKHPEKLALLSDPSEGGRCASPIGTKLLTDIEPDHAADLVVDCTGSPTGLPTALSLVRPRGTIVLKTTVAGAQTMALAPIVIDEVTILGSRCGPFDRALTALAADEVSVRPLISARYNLSDGVAALEQARDRPALKVLIDVQ
jgi:threonine dehydrogenase-like Zn-dependent dehydrogenase